MQRRGLLLGGIGVLAAGGAAALGMRLMRNDEAPLGFVPDRQALEKARALLRANPAIDIHAHPGRTFVRGAEDLAPALIAFSARGAFEAQTIAGMREGLVCGGSFAAVADLQTLDLQKGGGLASRRAFKQGEAWASYRRQVANLKSHAKSAGASIVSEPGDFARIKGESGIAAFLTVEGADFLESDVARVATSFADGIRSITLVHYRPNDLGDIQTAPAVHNGLTPFGVEVIAAMERVGMVVDLAHAAEPVAFAALEAASRPMMCSHTHLQGHGATNPRFIGEPLARAIAGAGGVIGAWPAGIGASTLNDYVDRIFDLAEVVGPDHVSMGTDMDANYKPVMTSYRQMPLVVSELLRRGYGEENTVKFLGGNFLRVFEATWAGRSA